MSALPADIPVFRPMREGDLDAVMAIENAIYTHPWSRVNFIDSVVAGYRCVVMECGDALAGYGVLMTGVGESHLLNLSIAADWQGKGYGRVLLDHFLLAARRARLSNMLLEVRPSNVAARRLYESAGFHQIAVRRDYYPAVDGREDALLLELRL